MKIPWLSSSSKNFNERQP